MTKDIAIEEAVPFLGSDWFDPLEAGVRQQIRSFIEGMLDDFGPRHPAGHDEHGRGHEAAIHHDNVPFPVGFDESLFTSPLRDEAHWLFS